MTTTATTTDILEIDHVTIVNTLAENWGVSGSQWGVTECSSRNSVASRLGMHCS
jgi:hypothetical protein